MNRTISDSIRYIGVDDNGIQLFENQFALPDGMCYNSYLILDEKIAILDHEILLSHPSIKIGHWNQLHTLRHSPHGDKS